MLFLCIVCLIGIALLICGSMANAAVPARGPWQIARHMLYG